METIAVFVDDAPHALQVLEPMRPAQGSTRWVLVACAPRLTHRIGKWVAHSHREQWRARWSAQLFEQLRPALAGASVEQRIAKGPLPGVVADLRSAYGSGLRVLDARRPKLGPPAEAVATQAPGTAPSRWAVPIAVSSGLSVMLALTD